MVDLKESEQQAVNAKGDLVYVQQVLDQARDAIHNLTIRAELAEIKLLEYSDLYLGRKNRIHPFVAQSLDELVTRISLMHHRVSNAKESKLGEHFTRNGSDKNTRHSYAFMYEEMVEGIDFPKILEIGLGSANPFPYGGTNEDGPYTLPGGSLRSFRDRFPGAILVGADIDPDSVNSSSEEAYLVDQTSINSLRSFTKNISERVFDLIIDDGFHDPHANINTFFELFDFLSDEGFYVIEDVHSSLISYWLVVIHALGINGQVVEFLDKKDTDDNVVVVIKKRNSNANKNFIDYMKFASS